MNIMEVVGTMFFKNGKLLIDKPRKRPTFQMIGGKVENTDKDLVSAAIRECHEELGNQFIFDEKKLEFVCSFVETATSDPTKKIRMNIFKYVGEFSGDTIESEEIEKFMWFGINDNINILSNSLKNEVIPMCLKKEWIN